MKLLNTSQKRPFINRFSGNLVIFCSDERFVQATLDFLKKDLGVETSDLVVIAGGPAFIPKQESSLIERLNLLIYAHQIKKVILISHENCGYYKHHHPNLSSETLEKLQIEDLKKSLIFLKERGLKGQAFLAYVEKDQILFKEINQE
ncbi:MAG: hypothetical protein NZ530_04620 [Thermodesulfobacteriaceae bacterium]|nr:hypothetical protein [Thermodesulfobacteriaceae bacterium]MDW8136330.1 hypothetical protein [Thermodesulfobacterium sp.]